MEDVLGWVAVLIVSIILMFAEIPILDPILSLLITAFVLKNVVQNFRQIIKIFLQAVPEGYDVSDIEKKLKEIYPAITEIHSTRLWTLDGQNNIMTSHISIKGNPGINEIIKLRRSMKKTLIDMGIGEVALEFENLDNCSDTDPEHLQD